MHVQVGGHFANGHHFDWPRIVGRLGSTLTFHLNPPLTGANSQFITKTKEVIGSLRNA